MMVKIERKITPKERENSTVRIDPNSSPKMNANLATEPLFLKHR